MLSVQKLLNTLNEIKSISGLDLGLYQANGKVVTETMEFSEALEDIVQQFVQTDRKHESYSDYHMYKVYIENEMEYVLVTAGQVENSYVIGQMAVCQICNLILSKTEDFDRNNFIQNVLLGNMLTMDIYSKAKKMHIDPVPRVAFVIDTGHKSTDVVMELVKNLSDLKAGDFVTPAPH